MTIAVTLADTPPDDTQVLGVPVFAGRSSPDGAGASLDWAWLAERNFEGKVGETVSLPADDGSTIVAIGVGPADEVSAETLRRAAAAFVRAAWRDTRAATTLLASAPSGLDPTLAAQALVEGALLASYKFTTYKSAPKACRLESLAVVGAGDERRSRIDRGARVAAAVAFARDLVNEPAATMTPRRLAEIAAQVAEDEGLTFSVLDEVAIVNEGLGGLAGVALGSRRARPAHRVGLRPARRGPGHDRPGGQGDHVRLRRVVDQDGRGHGDDEDRQVGGRRRAGGHVGDPGAGAEREGRRHHPGQREHARWQRRQARVVLKSACSRVSRLRRRARR